MFFVVEYFLKCPSDFGKSHQKVSAVTQIVTVFEEKLHHTTFGSS